MEFLLWLTGLRTRHHVCGDLSSIPGLALWVKDPALPQAAVKVTDAARIPRCCGSGLGRRPVAAAPIRPLAWEPPYAAGAAQEIATTTTKDKKTKK